MLVTGLLLSPLCVSGRTYKVGVSLSMCNGKDVPTEAQLREIKDAGIDWVEVVMNPFSRYASSDEEGLARIEAEKALLDKVGLKVWSCHLPYGRGKLYNYDVSVLDDAKREEALCQCERMIELAAIFSPKRIVLHPSAEPIPDSERQARMDASKASIGRLAPAVKKIGAVLCVEDLPRTCIGRNSEEIMYLIGDYPEVMITFDVNHLLGETHDHFFSVVGRRIGHIHASDYDGVDERHWIEGAEGGIIDWPKFLKNLKRSGYKGIFMHEVRSGDNVNPANIVKAYRETVCGKKRAK